MRRERVVLRLSQPDTPAIDAAGTTPVRQLRRGPWTIGVPMAPAMDPFSPEKTMADQDLAGRLATVVGGTASLRRHRHGTDRNQARRFDPAKALAFRFLVRRYSPITPMPDANRGRAVGIGVMDNPSGRERISSGRAEMKLDEVV